MLLYPGSYHQIKFSFTPRTHLLWGVLTLLQGVQPTYSKPFWQLKNNRFWRLDDEHWNYILKFVLVRVNIHFMFCILESDCLLSGINLNITDQQNNRIIFIIYLCRKLPPTCFFAPNLFRIWASELIRQYPPLGLEIVFKTMNSECLIWRNVTSVKWREIMKVLFKEKYAERIDSTL